MTSARRLNLAIDGMCVAVAAAAVAALLGWWHPLPSLAPVPMPAVPTATTSDGILQADIDHESLKQTCANAGLPEPPDLRGVDAVPVQRLMQAMADWQHEREPSALGKVGQIYLALGLDRPALECFAAAAASDPESTLWTYMAGVCCQSLGEDAAARTLLERSRERDPAHAVTAARLGTLALEAGELDAAGRHFDEFLRRQANSPVGSMGLGQVALARGDAAAAEKWFERSVAVAPNDFRAWRLYGRALALNGKIDQSREAFARGNALPQYDGWGNVDDRLAQAHDVALTQTSLESAVQRGLRDPDPSRAISALEAMHHRRPQDIPTIGNLALAYHRAGRADTALTLVRNAANRYPDSALAHECVADVTYLLQRYDESLAASDKVIRIDPQRVRGLELRSRALYNLGKPDEAMASLAKAIELDTRRDDLRVLLATLLAQSGRAAEAEPILAEVLSRDANNAETKALLERIRANRVKPSYGPG